jgi:asparagine synthase (glutamine-hydrolysing)
VPILARHFDEPFADSSAVPTYRVSQIAKEHITVALSGEGGDELLGGYNRYQAQRIVDLYHRLPRLLRPQWVESMILGFRTPTTYFGSSLLKSSQYFLEFARGVRKKGWQSWLLYFDEPFRQTLLTPAARDMIADAHARPDARQEQDIEQVIEKSASLRGVERLMWIDLMTYLPDDILVKVDRMSMAVGLECRAPLLDHKLIEWLARIPLDLKLRGMTRKYLLRRLAERYFPKNMFNGPKRGFMMPLAGWLHGNLGQWILDRLRANDPFNKLVSMPAVDMLFESHRAKKDDHSYRIWALLMLAEFLQLAEVSI